MTQVLADLRGHSSARYVAGFIGWLAAFAVFFEATRDGWVRLFMLPLTRLAQMAMTVVGLPAKMVTAHAEEGYCLLQVEGIVYRVTFECTGIFALFLFAAAILSYPARPSVKLQGLLLGVPAFLTYSILRLVILGLVAHGSPSHIELFHLYVMVVANVGFVLTLWLYWLSSAVGARLP